MEWRLAGVMLLFRALHAGQLAATLPVLAVPPSRRLVAAVLFAILLGESAWFVYRLVDRHEYAGWPTAVGELLTAAGSLCLAAVVVPASGDRVAHVAPLLALSTGQVSGVALARNVAIVAAGPALVAVAYASVIASADPSALGRSDVVIGISGYFVIPALVWISARYLRRLAVDLDKARGTAEKASAALSAVEEQRRFGAELHNYMSASIGRFLALDPHDTTAVTQTRHAFEVVESRLRTYLETGRFSQSVPLLEMIDSQIDMIGREGLVVVPAIAGTVRKNPPTMVATDLDLLENTLRAVLINARYRAGVPSALLRLTVEGDRVRVLVADRGRGFDPAVLSRPSGSARSLARHRRELRERGGDLDITSEPGRTQVLITLPVEVPAGGHDQEDGQLVRSAS